MALGFIAAAVLTAWGFRRRGLSADAAMIAVIGAMVGGLIGAKLHYLLINPGSFPQALFSGRGLVWYGGLLGGTLGVLLALRLQRIPVAPAADAIGPALAAGYAFGRLGCFLNGCCHGLATSLPWGTVFPAGSPPTSVPVHPTQLYEALASLLILAILLFALQPRLRRNGALFWSYVVLAGLERLLVEFLRVNERGFLGLTQQQWISVAMILVGLAVLAWMRLRRPAPAASAPGAGEAVADGQTAKDAVG